MTPQEVKSLREEVMKAVHDFRDAVDKRDAEVKELGSARLETKQLVEKLNSRIDDLEAALAKKTVEVKEKTGEAETAAVRATEKFLRYGLKGNAALDHMSDDERKSFSEMQKKSLFESADAQGGILVPEDFRLQIVRKIPNFANVGSLVNRVTTARDMVRWPTIPYTTDDIKTSGLVVTWEDEKDTATETDFSMSSVAVPVHKARALVKIANDLLEDNAVDIIGLLTDLFAQAYGIEEDSVFTNGSGGKKPEGFVTNTDISAVNNGHATVLQYDGLVNWVYTLPEQYAGNATIMVKRATVALMRQIKDSQNNPLWQPSLQVGAPSTFMGVPVKVNEQMPTVASAAKPGVIADFRQLYVGVDRIGLTIKRLDEKYADSDETGFIARRRFGGKVVAPWAAKKLNMA